MSEADVPGRYISLHIKRALPLRRGLDETGSVVAQDQHPGGPPDGSPAPRRPPGPRPKAATWAKVSIIVGIVIVVLSTLFVGGVTISNMYASSKLPQEALLAPEDRGKPISGALNILLLGMDERTGEVDLIHADSIIVLHVNESHTQAYLVSVPRDALVSVPAFPASKFPGTSRAKLTEAFAFGNQTFNSKGGAIGDESKEGRARGVQLLAQVLSNLVPGGLKFDAVAIVSFDGFQSLVMAMGGIDNMCVDETTYSEHFNNKGGYVSETYGNPKTAKTYPVGCYPMLPWEALDFVRQRHYLVNGDGDYGRQRHQQQFLLTVFKQLYTKKTLTDISKITGIMNAAGKLLTVDLGGHPPLDWAYTLQNIGSNNLTMVKTNGGKYAPLPAINGIEYEEITPDMIKLLSAVKADNVDGFLQTHPTWGSAPAPVTTPTSAAPTTKPAG